MQMEIGCKGIFTAGSMVGRNRNLCHRMRKNIKRNALTPKVTQELRGCVKEVLREEESERGREEEKERERREREKMLRFRAGVRVKRDEVPERHIIHRTH